MNLQLTDAGVAALNADTGPITLNLFKIGDGFGYVPEPTDTDIHGTLQFSGMPSAPVAANANVVKYGCYMDYSVGPFPWGEVGLFMDTGVLFALGSSSTLLQKLKQTGVDVGNSVRLDIYLSVVDQNYEMWMDVGESNNKFRLAVLQTPDVLPPSKDATPNAYVIQGASSTQVPMIAFTDRNGLWSFDAYAFINQVGGTIVGFDSQSVTIDASTFTSDMQPGYFGELIFEFTSGVDYSICRYIQSATNAGGVWKLGFATPLLVQPVVGDTFIIFKRQALSISNVVLPIASATLLGGVKIGQGLAVTPDGILSIDPLTAGFVTSVNGETGDVEITATNLPGLSTVGKTNDYNDLDNKPVAYVLPTASTTVKGGVKMPTNGNIVAAADGTIDIGFTPVKTVNGVLPDAQGNVKPPPNIGLVNPQVIPPGSDLNAFQTAGLFFTDAATGTVLNTPAGATSFTLEVVPFTTTGTGGDVIQRLTSAANSFVRAFQGGAWSAWSAVGGQPPIASTTTIGVVQVGDGLAITGGGILSTIFKSVNHVPYDPVTGDLTLTAQNVGALSAADVGTPGNLPGLLTSKNGTVGDPGYEYTNGRLPGRQMPIGGFIVCGTLDGTNGTLTATPPPNAGLPIQEEYEYINLQPNGQVTVLLAEGNFIGLATGRIFSTSVAGTFAVDGITSWAVGDLAISLNGKWHKWSGTQVTSVNGIAGDASGNVVLTQAVVNSIVNGQLTGPTTMEVRASGTNALYLNRTSGGNTYFGNGAGGTPAYVDTLGNGFFTNATALSDERYKHKFGSLLESLKKLLNVRYFTYELIANPGVRYVGTSAQSLQKQATEAVTVDENGILRVDVAGHTAFVGAAVQDLYRYCAAMNDRLNRANQRIVDLENLTKGIE